jgi:uncharacterized membrane protein YhhN
VSGPAVGLLVAAAICAVVEWWAVARGDRRLQIVFKPATTALLVGVAATAGTADTATRVLLVLAALCGLAGDVALLGDGENSFLAGLGAFAVGHALYVAAALAVGQHWPAHLWALPFLAVLLGWRFLPETVPGARRHGGSVLMGAVLVYAAIISAMVVTATGTGHAMAAVGAMAFAASDWVLGYNRFVRPVRYGALTVMIAYYIGQALLILGLALA